MSAKDLNKTLEKLIIDNKNAYITYEELLQIFPKQPTAANSKKVLSLLTKNKVDLKMSLT